MKKIVCLLLVSVLMQVEMPTVEAKVGTKKATIEAASSEKFSLRKRRRNRQRKGFMWGLFRKRNACDCPRN